MARIRIGTSGWNYGSWRGRFFPRELMLKHQLRYYATQFDTVELNGVFYRTPSMATVRAWRDQTADDFVFAWKASKFITHWKRLSPTSRDSIALMESRLRVLGEKAGPVLFQLPPHLQADDARLAAFLKLLKAQRSYVFEFRHNSWHVEEIFKLLRAHNVALCLSDHHDAPAPWVVTARHVYVRGHGPGGRYYGRYPASLLRAWARDIRIWQRQRRDVYVYFDNDDKSAAPADAMRLKTLLASGRA